MNRQERKDELIKQAVELMADKRVEFVCPVTPNLRQAIMSREVAECLVERYVGYEFDSI